ncbi:hypothetical protein QJS10_CPA08g01116 [Acorus calamus]|uniref:Magnesium transporter n=1 Tax=Acorus calamus TaxID=4465 RepID=A0AAV9EDS3_ACOCL|nr:hypothetical protein QJS10_CPA08g01116 [Acorus calamus]
MVVGVLYTDNLKGFVLAVASSAFIGASFILKKKGLKRSGASGPRAVHTGNMKSGGADVGIT